MFLTEEEAKTKWCPETRIHEVRGAGVYVNKPITDENPHGHANAASVLCIGSACMAWRWADEVGGEPAYRRTPVKDAPGHFDNVPLGYCGKAGKP